MNKRFVVVALVAAFALAGCTTMVPQRRQVGLVEGVARLPFTIVGGVITGVTGYNIMPTEADVRIAEYAVKQYGYRTRAYYVCLNGAYGSVNDRRSGGYRSFDDFYRNGSGLAKGQREHEQRVWRDCENTGRAIGNQGM